MSRRTAALAGLVALLASTATGCAAPSTSVAEAEDVPILVAAASDLRPAFEEVGHRFTAETGTPVTFDFGSSGQLAQRIVEGAPVDVFASADVAFVEEVLAAGVGDAATQRTYAFGRLVIWSSAARWEDWSSLEELAADEAIVHLAIANPEHAPYGAAAQEALTSTGVRETVRDRLVLGENVSDAQRLVETGNADVGIIALSLAMAADERAVGRWTLIDDTLHAPLQQDLVVTSTAADRVEAARAFADLVTSEPGREVMRRHGFVLPGEAAS